MTDVYLGVGAVLVIAATTYAISMTQYRPRVPDRLFWLGVSALFVIVVALIARLATGV